MRGICSTLELQCYCIAYMPMHAMPALIGNFLLFFLVVGGMWGEWGVLLKREGSDFRV